MPKNLLLDCSPDGALYVKIISKARQYKITVVEPPIRGVLSDNTKAQSTESKSADLSLRTFGQSVYIN